MAHLQHNQLMMNRVKRILGQMKAIEQAMQDGQTPCIDVLQQVAAAKGALNGLMNELIEEHLKRHVLLDEYNHAELEQFLKLLKKYG